MRSIGGKVQAPRRLLRQVLKRSRASLVAVAIFSGVINTLALTGSFYMLQVYDRVLPSRSVETLVGLSVLMAGIYTAYGCLDFIRIRVLSRIGADLDHRLRDDVFAVVQVLPLRVRRPGDGLEPVRDLDQVRVFLSGLGPAAFLDLPWVPIYLAVVFVLHPVLGLFALAGALTLTCLTLLTEVRSAGPMLAASRSGSARLGLLRAAQRNAEVVQAMGLRPHLTLRWGEASDAYLADQLTAADAASGIGTVSKVLRMLMQSGMLGLGAFLVIKGEVSAGSIIAASITMSRALAPIESAIGHWRGFVSARQSLSRLSELLPLLDAAGAPALALPTPSRTLGVEALTIAPPGATRPAIRDASFELAGGDGLGVIGPSASGKSTLARALVGVWRPAPLGGAVRLDGAALGQWPTADLGRHIGYLPQDVELFQGSVADNICRFDSSATSERVVAAARAAGVHDMIVRLPDGYQTDVGEAGAILSAGQRQRVALARALFGDPFLVVLDEPNSNLDAAGDAALTEAVRGVRRRGGIVVVIAHRPSALLAVDKLLVMAGGRVQAFGDKETVLRASVAPAGGARERGNGVTGGGGAGAIALCVGAESAP